MEKEQEGFEYLNDDEYTIIDNPKRQNSGLIFTDRYFIHHNNKVRKLTLKECFRLMGFDDSFKIVGSKSKLYNRIGNSIVIPMVQEIAKEVKSQILDNKKDANQKNKIVQKTYLSLL